MIAIVKYNAGNIQSVLFALERLGKKATWTDDPDTLRQASHVIFPGVGEASTAMHYLRERGLDEVIRSLQQPVLGICLGMQVFCRHSEENNTDCLGIFDAQVKLFRPPGLKVPHMGWNQLEPIHQPVNPSTSQPTSQLFKGIKTGEWAYFVHSFYAEQTDQTIATCQYGAPFSAALQRDNFYAVQFHPEKSGETGQKILSNFLAI